MATIYQTAILCFLCFLLSATSTAATGRALTALVKEQPLILKYHNGALLKGHVTLNFVWYGHFSPSQKAIILDFFQSLNPSPKNSPAVSSPSAASWWHTTSKYRTGTTSVSIGKQLSRPNLSVGKGKTLTDRHLVALARGFNNSTSNSVTVILTAKDVLVDGFCSRCGSHGSTPTSPGRVKTAYIWVGNSETQCPGQCAWPFHQPQFGPQDPPLVSPNGDVGVDGMVINLATLIAGTVTNPFENGYFMGPKTAPLEAVSACTGKFGSGAYPGYPGKVLTDERTGASFNANGVRGRKFLLPAMWDPKKLACATLV